jgi:DHA2 family multidrug resistance protein-like MFS transporter
MSGVGLTVLAVGLGAGQFDAGASRDVRYRVADGDLRAGFRFFNTANNRAVIVLAPAKQAGSASGMQAAARLVGQTIGVALVFGLAPVTGTTVTLVCAAAIALAAAGVSLLRMME